MKSAREPPKLALHLGGVLLEAEIGRGATSIVYRARPALGGGALALKVGRGPEERLRLAEEAERLALVDTPEIPRVLDAGVLEAAVGDLRGRPYLALEWIEGSPLSLAAADPALRVRTALTVARDVGRALSALHAAGVAHGDVKPDNVMARPTSSFALLDLGLGDAADRASPRGGTPRYLAPECFLGEDYGDGRARDLWALGAILAELVCDNLSGQMDLRAALSDASFPPEIAPLIRALVSPAPSARPPAEYVSGAAGAQLGDSETSDERAERRKRAVQTTYLAVRRPELLAAARGRDLDVRVDGIAGQWLRESMGLICYIRELRGSVADELGGALVDLDAFGRSRWITQLVGATAARWPMPTFGSDSAVAERLLARVEEVDPRSLVLSDLVTETPSEATSDIELDPIRLALSLGTAAPSPIVLERTEALVATRNIPALTLALGAALRRRGEIGRALAVLARSEESLALVESAECSRRAGDPTSALLTLGTEPVRALARRDGPARARIAAIRARIAFDRGDPDEALALLRDAPKVASTLEVRALAEIALGRIEQARATVSEGLASADGDESRARLAAVSGNLFHAAGESNRALDAFLEAADHATRAGAFLEEATSLTGVAAAGLDAGRLSQSLDAATRAALLFEHLGRKADAARAMLARAAVFSAVRAVPQATEAALDAERRARAAGDVRCRAFAHLVLADVLPSSAPDGLEHAVRAAALLEGAPDDDRLRAAARKLARDADLDLGAFDPVGEAPSVAVTARLDWWGARAGLLVRQRSAPERADRVLAALGALAAMPGPVPARGQAFSAGARLAARVGDAEMARRLAAASAEAGRLLVESAPPELRSSVLGISWLTALRPPRESGIAPEQLADIEALVRSLNTEQGLRPLLDQVLDALVLWTGVERGLLLLRAPEGRLVPRAARNIARRDLRGAQLELSHSLAARALQTTAPVVAVDAAGELPEVHQSVHALKLRSVLALPLLARGEAIGVVYLDDRVRRGAFGPSELSWVRLVAALAAIAIADARGKLELRRAVRHARRAEAHLAQALAQREAELDLAQRELARSREARTTRYAYEGIVGTSTAMRSLFTLLDRVIPTEVPVLVTGESGSGKELVARAIHGNGPRARGPFVSENCGAIPEGLLESVLFGHVRGAFTGASRPHAGLFEIASGGTLFLDEVGEMSLGMQAKLLRVLEDGEVRPVGSERSRKVQVRIITATHRDLSQMSDSGAFRRDLFYRLNVIRLDVPPLRERSGDIELLVRHFIGKHAKERAVKVSRQTIDLLAGFSWPGNVRQLENELRRALVLADDVIRPEHLSQEVRDAHSGGAGKGSGLDLRSRVDALETELVTTALERTSGNQTRAAELLGVSRFGLQKMMRRLGIRVPLGTALRDDAGAVTDDR